jgi:hypothetical protein
MTLKFVRWICMWIMLFSNHEEERKYSIFCTLFNVFLQDQKIYPINVYSSILFNHSFMLQGGWSDRQLQ